MAKEAYRMGHIDHQLQLEGVTKKLIKGMQKEGMLPKPKVKKTECTPGTSSFAPNQMGSWVFSPEGWEEARRIDEKYRKKTE